MWEAMNVTERYPAVDPEKAKGTKPNTMEFIRDFYKKAYDGSVNICRKRNMSFSMMRFA